MAYRKEKTVPKEICEMISEGNAFLCFASMMEEKEKRVDFYHYKEVCDAQCAAKKDFFEGDPSQTALLKIIRAAC